MRKAQLVSVVNSLLPPGTRWPTEGDIRGEGGRTVLMLVARLPDARVAIKLIDLVCPSANFWARDSSGRHVIMDACYQGVHPSVLLRLTKWARKGSLATIVPMSRLDVNGLDAMELAITEGHGALASCLLDQHDPTSYSDSLCNHYPLEVLELAIESRIEQSVMEVLANKRVLQHLQPGSAKGLNTAMRWERRHTSSKRLFNVFTCVEAAVRCNMAAIVQVLFKINPDETRQGVWYAACKLKSSASVSVSVAMQRMASSYLLEKLWPQLRVIVLLRHCESLTRNERSSVSLWQRRRRRWDWDVLASHPLVALPSEMFARILSFVLPSETSEMTKMALLVKY